MGAEVGWDGARLGEWCTHHGVNARGLWQQRYDRAGGLCEEDFTFPKRGTGGVSFLLGGRERTGLWVGAEDR